MEHVHPVEGREVNIPLHEIFCHKMAAAVQVHSPPGIYRAVLYRDRGVPHCLFIVVYGGYVRRENKLPECLDTPEEALTGAAPENYRGRRLYDSLPAPPLCSRTRFIVPARTAPEVTASAPRPVSFFRKCVSIFESRRSSPASAAATVIESVNSRAPSFTVRSRGRGMMFNSLSTPCFDSFPVQL